MENASKALLISAGILIGVMILTIMVVLFTTFGDMGKEYNQRIETQNIQAFNAQFTKYEDTNLKAQDVLTLANLVKEWNDTGTNEQITMIVNGSNYTTVDYDFLIEQNNEINIREENIAGNIIQVTVYPTFTMVIQDYYSSGRVKSIKVD